jgi:hypothetical protein
MLNYWFFFSNSVTNYFKFNLQLCIIGDALRNKKFYKLFFLRNYDKQINKPTRHVLFLNQVNNLLFYYKNYLTLFSLSESMSRYNLLNFICEVQ